MRTACEEDFPWVKAPSMGQRGQRGQQMRSFCSQQPSISASLYCHQYDEHFPTFRCADMVSEFDMDGTWIEKHLDGSR